VLEHVPDVDRTLDALEALLNPGGRIYLTTPNGAYEQGRLDQWERVERKGHLRALPWHQLADLLMRRGRIVDFRVHAEGRLSFVSYTPSPVLSEIVFYAGAQWEP
jgi:hypothetical protein